MKRWWWCWSTLVLQTSSHMISGWFVFSSFSSPSSLPYLNLAMTGWANESKIHSQMGPAWVIISIIFLLCELWSIRAQYCGGPMLMRYDLPSKGFFASCVISSHSHSSEGGMWLYWFMILLLLRERKSERVRYAHFPKMWRQIYDNHHRPSLFKA